MTNATKIAFAGILTAAAVLTACRDERPDTGIPTAPKLVRDANGAIVLGACTNLATLNTLAAQVFGSGSPNVSSVLGKLDNLNKKVQAGDIAGAQAQANNIVSFIRDKAADGRLAGSSAIIDSFINSILCFAGLSPNTYLIQPSDQPQVKIASDSLSGISLPINPVGTPTLLTITTLSPTGPSPLITKLDKYPTYTDIRLSSPLTGSAIVAVCPSADVPSVVRPRLRLGHQATAGFELTPKADGSFLPCGAPASLSQSRMPGWLRTVASILIPKPLYARQFAERGGVGGLASEFSPFGAVDGTLELDRGGVGGLATEFKKTGTTRPAVGPSATAPATGTASLSKTPATGAVLAPTLALAVDACGTTVGTEVTIACRPAIFIRTHTGTPMIGVPVNWAVTAGGGRISPVALPCGTINQTSLSTTTDAGGRTGICWKVGPDGGTNSVTAIPVAGTAGSDAPAGVHFFSDSTKTGLLFTIEGLKITPTASATGGSFAFDNSAHAGSGTCSNGLTPALTYSGGAAPTAVGDYTLTVTCGESSTVYNTVAATATISITAVAPTVSVSCPASVTYSGAAQTPCTATVTGPGRSEAATPSYSNNTNAGTATASVSVLASGNFGPGSGLATFAINAAPVTATAGSYAGPYTGTAHAPTSCSVTGAFTGAFTGDLTCSNSPASATNVVESGLVTATAAGTGLTNFVVSVMPGLISITKAGSTVTTTCSDVVYNGTAQTPCTATPGGVGTVTGSASVSCLNNTDAGTGSCTGSYGGDANHTSSTSTATTFSIAKAPVTATAGSYAGPYTGTAHAPTSCSVTGAFTGAFIGDLTCTNSPASATNVAESGSVTATAAGTGLTNFVVSVIPGSISITAVAPTVSVSCPASVTYNGTSQSPCTATVTGPGRNEAATPSYSNNTGAGTATASVSVLASGNFGPGSGSATFAINAAPVTATAGGYSSIYDGAAHALTDCVVTGAYTVSLSCTNSPASVTNVTAGASAPVISAGANFAVTLVPGLISVTKAGSTVTMTCSGVVYNGTAQTPLCTATPGGAGTVTGSASVVSCSNNTDAGTGSCIGSYDGDANHTGSTSAPTTFSIAKAPVTATAGSYTGPYTGAAHAPNSCSVTGAFTGAFIGDLTCTNSPASATNVVESGPVTATAAGTGLSNFAVSAIPGSISITLAAVTATAGSYSGTYDSNAHNVSACAVSGTYTGGLTGGLICANSKTTATNVADNGTVTPAVSGTGLANFTVSLANGSVSIAPATTGVALSCTSGLAYDGTVRNPCTASASGPGLATPLAVTYNPFSPRNAGIYGASSSFLGGGNYVGSGNNASFEITKRAATATSGNATINFDAAVPAIPCTVAGLLGVDAGSVTCTSSVPPITAAGSYPVTPLVIPPNPMNYTVVKTNGTLTVAGYVQVGCFSSPVFSVMPLSKSAQQKGSNLPIKCTLQTPQGAAVTTATGNIQVIDAGTTVANPPVKTGVVVFSANNIFKFSTGGNYAYGLDTSPAAFIAGHYYYVIANWKDGSRTEGWFLLR